jgi:hypothetical protein
MSDDEQFRRIADGPAEEMHDMREMVQVAISRLGVATSEFRAMNNELASRLDGLVRTAVREEMSDVRETMEAERKLTEARFDTLAAEIQAKIEVHTQAIERHEDTLQCQDVINAGAPSKEDFYKLVTSTKKELHDFEMQVEDMDKRVEELEKAPGRKALVTMASIGGIITTGTIVGFGPKIVEWFAQVLRGVKP